jgi:phage terminase large subunit GpA-like protein
VSGPTFVDATIGGKRLRRGARLWTVAVSTFKAETYRFLRLERPSDEDRALGVCDAAGTMHLPAWADTEWLKQLVAEQMVTVRNKRGFGHQEWQKMRERNEALDCRVYARAAAWILGADRWDEATWRSLESQAGVETKVIPAPEVIEPTAPTAGTILTPRRRRSGAVTPKYMR